MADQINPAHYANMIEALNTFANNTSTTCEELGVASIMCTKVLGETDEATENILSNASNIRVAYGELIVEAQRIATMMQQELDTYMNNEAKAWADDSADAIE